MWNVFILSMLWCNIRFFSANVIRKLWLLKHKFSLENSPKCPYPTIPTFKALSAIPTKWDKGFSRWTMKPFFLLVGLIKYFRRACYYSHLLNNNCNTVNSRTSNQHALDLLLYPPPPPTCSGFNLWLLPFSIFSNLHLSVSVQLYTLLNLEHTDLTETICPHNLHSPAYSSPFLYLSLSLSSRCPPVSLFAVCTWETGIEQVKVQDGQDC